MMPIIESQGQRDALHTWLRNRILELETKALSQELTAGQHFSLLSMRISVAALESQPVAFYTNDAYYNTEKAAYRDGADEVVGLYEVPPVPVLKPVVKPDLPPTISLLMDLEIELRDRDWVKAIRESGYRVKG